MRLGGSKSPVESPNGLDDLSENIYDCIPSQSNVVRKVYKIFQSNLHKFASLKYLWSLFWQIKYIIIDCKNNLSIISLFFFYSGIKNSEH